MIAWMFLRVRDNRRWWLAIGLVIAADLIIGPLLIAWELRYFSEMLR